MDLLKLRKVATYSTGEAAAFVRVPPATVRSWVLGYRSATRRMKPVFEPGAGMVDDETGQLRLSFLQLVELVIANAFRERHLKLEIIRRAHEYAREMLQVDYPFASLKLSEDGAHIFHEFQQRESLKDKTFLVLSKQGQLTLPGVVRTKIASLDFDNVKFLATRWFPHGKDVPIVIDPEYCAGRPSVLGRGIRIETLISRSKVGETVDEIAEDFDLDRKLIEKVLKYAA